MHKHIQSIMRQAAEVSREIHHISHDLHPSKLNQLGLIATVKSLCNDLQRSHRLKLEFTHEGVPARLSQEISLCLYRIVQECLHNVIKHSGAQEAKVEIRGTANEIRLRVSDTGIGLDFESPGTKTGIGLVSMNERLRLVGGQISISSPPSQGTRIDVKVPLDRKDNDHEDPSPHKQTQAVGG
jgi:signal transduction histidine kinase